MLLRRDLNTERDAADGPARPRRWLQRLGVAAFAFFLIKGLLWLLVPALLITLDWIPG